MKFFGKSKFSDFVEKYHPLGSIAILLAIYYLKFYDQERFAAFTDVSYNSPRERDGVLQHDHYKKGPNDRLFVFFMINVVTVCRFLYRKLIQEPLARWLKLSKGNTNKFLEAGWFSLYFLSATVWGYLIFSDDPWWFDTNHLWAQYPQAFDYHMKYYYLSALAFWVQCLLSFFFEPSRKDDLGIFFHHLLTIGLVMSSYRFNFFRIGAAIMMMLNAADVFYYHAKLFKYCGFDAVATAILVVFVIVWVYTRHFLYCWILYSVWFEQGKHFNTPGWDDDEGYYYAEWLRVAFSIPLMALQILMLYWFSLILKVIWRTVKTGVSEDITDVSDSEDEVEGTKRKKSPKASASRKVAEPKKVK